MISEAISLAKTAHFGQTRKDGTPYINHPARVAMALSLHYPGLDDDMLAAAWLHDVVEDTHYTQDNINTLFHSRTAKLVRELTFKPVGLEHLSYRDRKLVQNNHIAEASYKAKVIKIFDRLDNLEDFDKYVSEIGAKYAGYGQAILYPDFKSVREGLASYLDVSWELVKLLWQQSSVVMNPDATTMLHIKCIDLAKKYVIDLK